MVVIFEFSSLEFLKNKTKYIATQLSTQFLVLFTIHRNQSISLKQSISHGAFQFFKHRTNIIFRSMLYEWNLVYEKERTKTSTRVIQGHFTYIYYSIIIFCMLFGQTINRSSRHADQQIKTCENNKCLHIMHRHFGHYFEQSI